MSHFLSEALGTDEPRFKQAIMGLERRSGHPNHDIRLSSAILQKVPNKLKELGLDPNDTTAEELYYALNHKLAEQDAKLIKQLRTKAAKEFNAAANLSDALVSIAKDLTLDIDCLAVKPSIIKQLLKTNSPRKVMKALNYRSIDSMLKVEPVPLLLLAVNSYESEAYITNFYSKYKKITPSNLELRKLNVYSCLDKKWFRILTDIKARTGLTMVSSYELASIILLPIDNQPPQGYLTLTLTNLLAELSITLSVSSYLKLHQVNADFGVRLKQIADNEPLLGMHQLDKPVSWSTAQHILAGIDHSAFAPHLTFQDILPVNLLSKLSQITEEFKFWEDNEILALVKSSEATSLNIRDVAVNLVNSLPFSKRQLEHFRHSLSQELMKLYISPEQVIDSLTNPTKSENQATVDNKAQAIS